MPNRKSEHNQKDTVLWNFRIQEINQRFLTFPDRKIRPQTQDQKFE